MSPAARQAVDGASFRAVVIGSGAGGAPAAAALAERWGEGVALVEAGPWLTAPDFTQIERDMVPRLYAGGGAQATEDGAVGFLQGRAVGGSTVINDAICFAPPPELPERWRPYGVELDPGLLSAYAAEVEARMGVVRLARSQVNRANYLVGLGAAKLGWAGERLRHNSPGCVQCGFRHTGCAYGVKRSMDLSFVPEAVHRGARLLPDTPVTRLERRGGRWRIHARPGVGPEAGRAVAFDADHVVVAAGVVQTPALLLRSGIPAGEGVQIHLQSVVWGDFAEPVDAFNGIPMAYGVLEFADVYGHRGLGYVMEGVGVQPMAFSVQPPAEGALKQEILGRYRHLAGVLMLLRSGGRGRIELGPDGRAAIHYPIVEADARRTAHFFARGAELFLAAGAQRALLAHRETRWVERPPDPAALAIEPNRQYLYTAHPFGGACRGTVTDGVGRVKGQPGLWVLDASAFPEAPGVNPQVTIAALAWEGAERLLADAGA